MIGGVGSTTASVASPDQRDLRPDVAAHSVGWHAAMAALRDQATPLIDDPARLEGVPALGIDETRFLSASPTTTPTT